VPLHRCDRGRMIPVQKMRGDQTPGCANASRCVDSAPRRQDAREHGWRPRSRQPRRRMGAPGASPRGAMACTVLEFRLILQSVLYSLISAATGSLFSHFCCARSPGPRPRGRVPGCRDVRQGARPPRAIQLNLGFHSRKIAGVGSPPPRAAQSLGH